VPVEPSTGTGPGSYFAYLCRWVGSRRWASWTEVAGSHAVYVSQPEAVAYLIKQATDAVAPQ